MDSYLMPIADMLVDAVAGNNVISFMDGNAEYNQIFMAEEDIHKTAFRCLLTILSVITKGRHKAQPSATTLKLCVDYSYVYQKFHKRTKQIGCSTSLGSTKYHIYFHRKAIYG